MHEASGKRTSTRFAFGDGEFVFRQGDTVILRLVGLSFDSGASKIKPENFDLLAKVEKAIDVFPRSELIIEGHTDSHGGDDLNQTLSQERAESVQQYMINAMRIPTYRLIATGYGETRPVASNETEAGRARNRRIDIVTDFSVPLSQLGVMRVSAPYPMKAIFSQRVIL